MSMPPNDILTTRGLTVEFGGLKALNDVSVRVGEGEILSVIGPNGAGKTTFFNAITGSYPPTSGDVTFRGERITGLKPYEIARKGVARSFQNLKPFAEMTVVENVLVGREMHFRAGLLASVFRTPACRADEQRAHARARELVDFVGLSRRRNTLARDLTYGEQKMLEIARALALEPKLILLDEPVAGMNPTETGFVMELVRKIKEQGITVLMIEHDMKMVMGISERIYVLVHGELVAEGSPQEVRNNPRVIEAYLGGGKNRESGIGNRESGIGNRESGIGNRESEMNNA
jgi:branched-chain amino acid transport system ATP-binding protein